MCPASEPVNLDQANARLTALARDDRRVGAGRQRDHDGRFKVVSRRHRGRNYFCFLRLSGLAVDLPVVIRRPRVRPGRLAAPELDQPTRW